MKPLDPTGGLLGLRRGPAPDRPARIEERPREAAAPADGDAAPADGDAPSPLACRECRHVEGHKMDCSRRVQTPALDPAVRAAWPAKAPAPAPPPREPPPTPRATPIPPSPQSGAAGPESATRTLRVVKLLRILEASPDGQTIGELARALDTHTRTIARDLEVLADADEPVEADGTLTNPATRVSFAREGRR